MVVVKLSITLPDDPAFQAQPWMRPALQGVRCSYFEFMNHLRPDGASSLMYAQPLYVRKDVDAASPALFTLFAAGTKFELALELACDADCSPLIVRLREARVYTFKQFVWEDKSGLVDEVSFTASAVEYLHTQGGQIRSAGSFTNDRHA